MVLSKQRSNGFYDGSTSACHRLCLGFRPGQEGFDLPVRLKNEAHHRDRQGLVPVLGFGLTGHRFEPQETNKHGGRREAEVGRSRQK